MSSEAKLAANRANALKSTGPRTDRGKTKSRLNAATHGIYATTPLLPGEDEVAYRAIENSNREHFMPIGPVETVLVRQITAEQWKLERIDRAEKALYDRMQHSMFERLIQSLDLRELIFLRSTIEILPDDHLENQKRRDFIAACDANVLPNKYSGLAKDAPELEADQKRDVIAKVERLINGDNAMLEALVPPTESAPQQCLDRERRVTMRVYLTYVEKLRELQEERLMVLAEPVSAKIGPRILSKGSEHG